MELSWVHDCAQAVAPGATAVKRGLRQHPEHRKSVFLPFSGISGKSQILFTLVFWTRYLDLFTNFVSVYNSVMKVGGAARLRPPRPRESFLFSLSPAADRGLFFGTGRVDWRALRCRWSIWARAWRRSTWCTWSSRRPTTGTTTRFGWSSSSPPASSSPSSSTTNSPSWR